MCFGLLRKSVDLWVCVCVYVCLVAITLDGSAYITGECTLTKVQSHSCPKGPQNSKMGRNQKHKNYPVFHGYSMFSFSKGHK